MVNELFHDCRWCKCNINGKCTKIPEVLESSASAVLYELSESGKLSEAIQEGLRLPNMDKLRRLLTGYGISQKCQKEILRAVGAELEEFIPTMVEGIDTSVGELFVNVEDDLGGITLTDPENFYCKYFR